jgi:uncharacterized membrane protein YbhN (UPF0104 family)
MRQRLHWLGSALALVGIVFVIIRMRTYWLELDFSKVTFMAWLSVATFAIIYGLSNLFLTSAWRQILNHLGVAISQPKSIKIYGISQLAKYLPGNIFHLAGRQALGVAAGLPNSTLAKSTLWELGLLVTTAILFSALTLPIMVPSLPVLTSILMLIGSTWIAAGIFTKLGRKQIAKALIRQVAFLAVSAGMFAALLSVISQTTVIPMQAWPTIGGAYVVAWLAGLITPGAPAGVGVRELVLLLLLKGAVQEADLLVAILLGRFITVTGDLLFFVCASLIKPEESIMGMDNV